jgi:hypothetical protein
MSYVSKGASQLSDDPFRASRWQPSTEDTNPNWVPQFQPATWQRPLSLVYKQGSTSRSSGSDSSDTTVPAWVKVKTVRASMSGVSEKEPVSDYKWSSKAALPHPPAAYISGTRAPPTTPVLGSPAVAPAPAPAPASVPPAPEKQGDLAPRFTTETERSSVRRASMAARSSREFVPPLPASVPQETASAESEEFEIPDFKYTVPHTPRYSSLPQHRPGPSSGLEAAPEHSFPPTPPSIAAQYSHLYTPRTAGAHVIVSPMPSVGSQPDRVTDDEPVPKSSEATANVLPRLVKVVGTFKPALADELALSLGETLRLLHIFPDDWCLVQRLFPQGSGEPRATSGMESGAVPILCLAEIGSGELVPRVPSSTSSSPKSPMPSARNETVPAPLSTSPAVSEGSGVSGASGQTGATGTTNATETTQLSEPRSHWSPATTALGSFTPITSPESDRSAGQVVKDDVRQKTDAVSPPIPSPGSSVASGQSLVVPPGLSGAGYMPRMPKKLDQVPKPAHGKAVYSNKIGMTLRNGSVASMLDRTRAS